MKSMVKPLEFYQGLVLNMAKDILQFHGIDSDRDLRTIFLRSKSEGMAFFTKTMPRLCKSVDRALQGFKLSTPNFKCKKGEERPQFLWKLFSQIFDKSGYILPEPDVAAITDLRQLLIVLYKKESDFERSKIAEKFDSFERVDKGLPDLFHFEKVPEMSDTGQVLRVARDLITSVFCDFDPLDIIPRHGPGAVSSGEPPQDKMNFKRRFAMIEQTYAFHEYFYTHGVHFSHALFNERTNVREEEYGKAKLMVVPKDSRGPRLISSEPLEFMWIQQGLGRKMMSHLETHPLTRGKVNFTDQTINGKLTLNWSDFITLDLSEASDRVSLGLVNYLFWDVPALLCAMLSCRSSFTVRPDTLKTIELNKFAPMGSALCFPVEAVVFWALTVAHGEIRERTTLREALNATYVYGDDILIPSHYLNWREIFHGTGLKLNQEKSCTNGKFRESCGVDAYDGINITPIKLKHDIYGARYSSDGVSLVEFRNNMYSRGYFSVTAYLDKRIRVVYGKLPHLFNHNRSGVLSLETRFRATPLSHLRRRYNADLQRNSYRCWIIHPRKVKGNNSDWVELLRKYVMPSPEVRSNEYTLPRRAKLARRWKTI